MATTMAQKSTSGDAKLLHRADSLVRWSTWEEKTHTHTRHPSVSCAVLRELHLVVDGGSTSSPHKVLASPVKKLHPSYVVVVVGGTGNFRSEDD